MKLISHHTTSMSKLVTSIAIASAMVIGASSVSADGFPDRPLTMVVPAGTGGTNDRAARLISRYLAEELGQPVQVVNRPGGGNMLGHVYFHQQPADGYTLMRSTAFPYMTVNQLVQGAAFEIEDFQPVNLSDIGTSIIATSNDSRFSSIDELLAEIREKPGTVSIGVQPTSTDMINLAIFLDAFGVSRDDVRIVTYDSGGPVRNGIIGGQFDVGAIGDQGMQARRDEFQTLMVFSEEPSQVWEAPHVLEVAESEGIEYPRVVSGHIQGYFVHTELMENYPERYAKIVEAFQNITENPEAIEDHKGQDLGIDWVGPEASLELMMRGHNAINDPELLELVRPN